MSDKSSQQDKAAKMKLLEPQNNQGRQSKTKTPSIEQESPQQQQKQQQQKQQQQRHNLLLRLRKPRSLAHFLPDCRDLRDVKKWRWRASRLPNGGDPRTRLLWAVHRLYNEYRKVFNTQASQRDCHSRALESAATAGDYEKQAEDSKLEASAGREVGFFSCDAARAERKPNADVSGVEWGVVQRRSRRTNRINQVLLRRAGGAEVWIDAPIALELRLPQIRAMLTAVMAKCPFITDPTEALAELRAARYNVTECVEYLQEVHPIWEVAVKESLQAKLSPAKKPSLGEATSESTSATNSVTPRLLVGLTRLRATLADCYDSVIQQSGRIAAVAAVVASEAATLTEFCRQLNSNAISSKASCLEREVEQMWIRYRDEELKRKSALNQLHERLGTIRVFVRCQRVPGEQALQPLGEDTLQVFNSRPGVSVQSFKFDAVFTTDLASTQQQLSHASAPRLTSESDDGRLFNELHPLIDSFLDGYNVCFVAYGAEASGKTHTLHGPKGWPERGLVYRSMAAAVVGARERLPVCRLELHTACVEIYNDALLDLGDQKHGPRRLAAGCLDWGLGKLFDSLCCIDVATESDALEAIRFTTERRQVAPTALNPQSSRSHLLHLMRLRGHFETHAGEQVCAFLGLIDLAGAENVIKAATVDNPARAAEASHINRSLASFNRLFLNLRRTASTNNVPSFRDSRLTQLMKPFLTDHGKCCIIVTVRSDRQSLTTSLSSLRFGRGAMQVVLGRARRQVV